MNSSSRINTLAGRRNCLLLQYGGFEQTGPLITCIERHVSRDHFLVVVKSLHSDQDNPSGLGAMVTHKRTVSSKTRSPTSTASISLKKVKGQNFYRDAKAVSRMKMLKGGKPVRDKDGKIIQAAPFQKTEADAPPGRVQPDRRWFGEPPLL